MADAVIVEALRSPIGRGKMGRGDLSGYHAAQLLGELQKGLESPRIIRTPSAMSVRPKTSSRT